MGSSMTTLLSAMLGDFDFGALREAHWLLGPVFFVSFMTIGVFVMLNMFIAIISDAYCDTKTEIENEDQMDVRAAVLDGDLYDEAGVRKLSKLGSLNEVRGQFLRILSAPGTQLVRLISEPGGQIARVLQARADVGAAGE